MSPLSVTLISLLTVKVYMILKDFAIEILKILKILSYILAQLINNISKQCKSGKKIFLKTFNVKGKNRG